MYFEMCTKDTLKLWCYLYISLSHVQTKIIMFWFHLYGYFVICTNDTLNVIIIPSNYKAIIYHVIIKYTWKIRANL